MDKTLFTSLIVVLVLVLVVALAVITYKLFNRDAKKSKDEKAETPEGPEGAPTEATEGTAADGTTKKSTEMFGGDSDSKFLDEPLFVFVAHSTTTTYSPSAPVSNASSSTVKITDVTGSSDYIAPIEETVEEIKKESTEEKRPRGFVEEIDSEDVDEPTKESVDEPTKESVDESVEGSVDEPIEEPTKESVDEPVEGSVDAPSIAFSNDFAGDSSNDLLEVDEVKAPELDVD